MRGNSHVGFGKGQFRVILAVYFHHYTPNIELAFNSVEYIMRDVPNGWLIRYIHANGASMFFIVVYAHIGRGLSYGSYMEPRALKSMLVKNVQTLKSFRYPFSNKEIKLFCQGKSGVYLILNEINQNCYIGSAFSKTENHNRLFIRFKNHFYNTLKSSSLILKRALSCYGIKNFSFHILEFTGNDSPRERENFYLKKVVPEYNILERADSSIGCSHTEETKIKMRQNYSLERKLKIGSLNKNKPLSETAKKKLSERAKNRYKDPVFIEKHKKSVQSVAYKFSKPVRVLDGTTRELIARLPSLKFVLKYYNYKVSYRHLKRCVSEKKVVKKLSIFVEYL